MAHVRRWKVLVPPKASMWPPGLRTRRASVDHVLHHSWKASIDGGAACGSMISDRQLVPSGQACGLRNWSRLPHPSHLEVFAREPPP